MGPHGDARSCLPRDDVSMTLRTAFTELFSESLDEAEVRRDEATAFMEFAIESAHDPGR
jgi:hypothetical protein